MRGGGAGEGEEGGGGGILNQALHIKVFQVLVRRNQVNELTLVC